MKLPIIQSSEEQKMKLKAEYDKWLNLRGITDPLKIDDNMKCADVTAWPRVHTGCIFAYILRVRDFGVTYIGRYKDQKAYSYWDDGFV